MVVEAVLWCACAMGAGPAEVLTLPQDKRPEWLNRDGIVMAGSWEPLLFRVRRDGGAGYEPTPEQRAAYQREHSPEMVARLKALGVNFVMTHCYKGGGMQAEGESMADAVLFAKVCHDAGIHVGVYNYSGAFIWELFFKEMPQAKDWVLLGPDGKPRTYGRAGYRYYFDRNHPDAEAYYRQLVRFAVIQIGADLIHFDNYHEGPGYGPNSVQRFRHFLHEKLPHGRLAELGLTTFDAAQPPANDSPPLLKRAWADFACQSLADSYHAMSRYARSLRPDVLVECNPGGVGSLVRLPVDHERLLTGGEAIWDESASPGYRQGRLQSRIRSYKLGRLMGNSVFCYTPTPLEAAESMAFNLNCLGAICWFEYANIVSRPGAKTPMSPKLDPYVRFFHRRRDLFRDAAVVADAAVLRSFPSVAFGESKTAVLAYQAEERLIQGRRPFQLISEHQLGEAQRYPVLILAGCAALGDAQVEAIRQYVARSGRLCVIGPLATHDQWMQPRAKPALDDLPTGQVVRAEANGDFPAALDKALGREWSLTVHAQTKSQPAKTCRTAVGQSLYSDRPWVITNIPADLTGLVMLPLSHAAAQTDATLRFTAKAPLRVYAAFAPKGFSKQWLPVPADWKLDGAKALDTTITVIGKGMDIYSREVPPGEITLFSGQRGKYVLLGVKPLADDYRGDPIEAPKTENSPGLCAELTDQPGRRLVHLVNYREGEPVRDVQVRLRVPAPKQACKVILTSPERTNDLTLPYRQKDGFVEFTLPQVEVYEIAVVAWQ